uniref:GHKL domain-containing protein n=1 Tax=Catenibacterium sp. TaxID=2049022 RepID=UPI004025F35F
DFKIKEVFGIWPLNLIPLGMDEDCFYIKNSYIESQIELNKDTSHGLGLYIVNNLLNNYQIDYEIIQNQNTYLFKIYKKDSQL